ncbi:MAG: hypothetical protein LUG83_06620 [Lachnospiraceae bacterium]|nr:hypothetical protein [Lachnospiraceae bacterium]
MARGQRKTIEEKIAAKEEIIDAMQLRLESEKKELQALYDEKKDRELERVNELIAASGFAPDEVAGLLRDYIQNREENPE